MGAIWCKKGEFLSATEEIVGYKSGLTLSRAKLKSFALGGYEDIFSDDQNKMIRLRAEEYEIFLAHILYRIGVISTDDISPFIIVLFGKYKDSKDKFVQFLGQAVTLYSFFELKLDELAEKTDIIFPQNLIGKNIIEVISHIAMMMTVLIKKSIEQDEYELRKELFRASILKSPQYKDNEILDALLIGLTDFVQRSPWISYRCIQWHDLRELDDLFQSEKLYSFHGKYFDQRFINYLSSQYDDIGNIHWRQFEGLAGEFLHREGFIVKMGAGRNDDNIDLRAWNSNMADSTPPTLLVQCKRYKDKVEKVVVKALWADIVSEKAQGGLIVTSSALSPGAQKTLSARAYPITEINRKTLKEWILKMRTPLTGTPLAE